MFKIAFTWIWFPHLVRISVLDVQEEQNINGIAKRMWNLVLVKCSFYPCEIFSESAFSPLSHIKQEWCLFQSLDLKNDVSGYDFVDTTALQRIIIMMFTYICLYFSKINKFSIFLITFLLKVYSQGHLWVSFLWRHVLLRW